MFLVSGSPHTDPTSDHSKAHSCSTGGMRCSGSHPQIIVNLTDNVTIDKSEGKVPVWRQILAMFLFG